LKVLSIYIYYLFYSSAGYRVLFLSKVCEHRGLSARGAPYGGLGDGPFGAGQRHERLAPDGSAGSDLPGRDGKHLDSDRPFRRDGSELEAGLRPA
jgi:hypothetical protein